MTIATFSSTGNSLVTARRLSALLGTGSVLDLAVQPVPDGVTELVVVFPVFFWGIPRIVQRWLTRIPSRTVKVWAVATNGGLAGDPHRQIRGLLQTQGGSLAGGYLVWMPENFIPRYPAWPRWLQRVSFRIADRKIRKIAGDIAGGRQGRIQKSRLGINFLLNRLNQKLNEEIFERMTLHPRDYFQADSRCVGCGLCARVCPVGNIRLDRGKPEFGPDCELCVSCVHWCPVQALQAGKATVRRGRYHHPEVSATDFLRR